MALKGIFSSPIIHLVLPLILVVLAGLAVLAFPRNLVTHVHRRVEIERMSRKLKRVGQPVEEPPTASRLHSGTRQ